MERSIEELPVLIALTGPLNGQRWPISGELIVGRDADCEVVVADRQVSRQHARFTVTEEGVTVRRWSLSSNGGGR